MSPMMRRDIGIEANMETLGNAGTETRGDGTLTESSAPDTGKLQWLLRPSGS